MGAGFIDEGAEAERGGREQQAENRQREGNEKPWLSLRAEVWTINPMMFRVALDPERLSMSALRPHSSFLSS